MDPDELAKHRAQASVYSATHTGHIPKASQKILENDCFADEVAIKKDAVAASKAAKQRRKTQGRPLVPGFRYCAGGLKPGSREQFLILTALSTWFKEEELHLRAVQHSLSGNKPRLPLLAR